MLRELARSYLTVVKDLSRVMNRLKALYRSWAIPCAGRDVYYTRHRSQWLEKIPEAGTRRRAEQLYQQLDLLQHLRQQARRELLNKDYNHDLKGLFKGAATRASVKPGPLQEFYQRSLAKGIKPTMVRLTLARKIAAITLTLWKKGEDFDINKLNSQAA